VACVSTSATFFTTRTLDDEQRDVAETIYCDKIRVEVWVRTITVSETSEIRTRVFRLLRNSLTLGFALIFFNLLRPELSSFITFEIGGLTITSETVLNIVSLVFIVYFGYFILIDAKYFLDYISTKLGSREGGKAKSLIYDIAAIISLILASQLLTPFAVSIPHIGNAVANAINIMFLVICLIIVYHLANELYYLIKKHVENLIQETPKQLRRKRKEKTNEGESK
jgi:hypothetical protein